MVVRDREASPRRLRPPAPARAERPRPARILAEADRAEPSDVWLDGLDEALAELAPELKEAVGLRVVHDLSYAELAEAVGTTPGAARVRVHRGLAALRARLLRTKEATR